MTLLLDAGNSRIKWARRRAGALSAVRSAAHAGEDALQVCTEVLGSLETPARLVVCSVLGRDFARGLEGWTQAHWGRAPELVTPAREAYGVTLAYEAPHTLGADRFAALVAARRRCARACVIVSCGTAVTFDALATGGRHVGGLIFPGPGLMSASLSARASGIPPALGSSASLFATTTADAVASGCQRATVAAIAAIVDDMVAAMAPVARAPVERLVTGGDGARFMPLLPGGYRLQPELVLEGLAIIAET